MLFLTTELGGLLGRERFDAGVQPALVAGRGVGVQNALLHALVEGGCGCLVLLGRGLEVALLNGLAEGAQAAADAALVGAVYARALFGLTDALQRGDMICHGGSELVSGIWDAGNSTSPAIDKFTGMQGKRQEFCNSAEGSRINGSGALNRLIASSNVVRVALECQRSLS
jgi:hypothetical protein